MSSSKSKPAMPAKSSERRSKELGDLQEGIKKRKSAFTTALAHHGASPKWKYPKEAMEIVKEAQNAAFHHSDLVSGELTRLLEWPSKEMTREDFFYEAKGANSMFDRNKEWFSDLRFHSFETQYSFSDRWDKQKLTVQIYVPKGLSAKDKSPVMWMFHGGGFCTGAADFIPWYSQTAVNRAKEKNAIIIAPNYPLGPEGNYKDISDATFDFLRWYKEDGYFATDNDQDTHTRWQDWLCSEMEKKGEKLTIAKEHVYIEGESAGAHVAVTAMWLNADGTKDLKIPIQAALLRFPMIAHYKRKILSGQPFSYMSSEFLQDDIKSQAEAVKEEILRLERLGIVPTCTGRHPPCGMAFAVILSILQMWQSFFQRRHGDITLDIEHEPGNKDFMDGIERAQNSYNDVAHELLPPIYIYHGRNDSNCPVEDTVKFFNTLRDAKLYGNRFKDDDTLFLDIVKSLNTKPTWNAETEKLVHGFSEDVGHGFDYYLDEDDEPFLKKAYDWVGSHWGA